MTDTNDKDVLVAAGADQLAHKWAGTVPEGHDCYWRVNGTPRRTGEGRRIWFAREGRLFATADILAVEKGRIWFEPVHPVDLPSPAEAPTRGFAYIEPVTQ